MSRIVFMFFLVVAPTILNAQLDRVFNKEADSIAYSHIQRLKNSVLFVRLRTNHLSIQKLEEQRKFKEADYLRAKAERENKSIIQAFKNTFTFCDVHFFLSESTEDVKWRDFDGIFVDDSLQAIPRSPIDEYAPFYTLDFGQVYFQTFSEHFEGIAVMDEYFQQLERPFPYFVRKLSGIRVVKRTDEEMVLELQKNLDEFYNQSIKRYPPK